ncbi:bifunctional riboflavin kinase/FAD synthetase [Psychrobacter phenylpyruvicus]|uniref:Riboflavin biosynthesis protein n=1 Tax=Psychrobacter phenylpyruvicus TaxID=29432 RepID=A0A379LLG7_9GAMM|nr:bifunctional riboflavin kinase/FAD synthetase [Psychrobacter phenylpyruvicus]SUD91383.1 Riboflavin biosynthesis protein ribF [Psychrobacter phenylpyruvicus]
MKTIFLDLATIHAGKSHSSLNADSVLTIGNFDGVHLGHQAMLKQLQQSASEQQLQTMVMIFEPQPREYFAQLKSDPSSAPARLTSQDEKLTLLAKLGIDTVVVAKFDEAFRSLSASEFADMLVEHLNVKSLVLGDDFKFGHDRTGDSEFLRSYGLPVTNLHTITDTYIAETQDNSTLEDKRISSTRIRELLAEGDLKTASRLLNRDYTITGKVVGGDKIGRTLDFPTANIELNRVRPALHGVYGVDVVILDEAGEVIADGFSDLVKEGKTGIAGLLPHSLFGTANIGIRPSVDKPQEWRLEVFFPEFSGNLYDKTLQVRFLHHLHDERKYESLEALKAGIQQDVIDLVEWRRNQHKAP